MGARSRLRELLIAGLTDSFGLSFGWTLFNLLAVARGGLATAGLCNAAMLAGVVLAAPAATWLSRRLPGRVLLTVTAGVEVVLRVGTLAALLAGWPVLVVAAGVLVQNVAAWTGFAAMRAEVAAVDARAPAMTRYVMGIAAVEAAGAGLAALLPIGPGGAIDGVVVAGVAALYGASLLPTFLSARRARVPRAERARVPRANRARRPGARSSWSAWSGVPVGVPVGALAGGGLVMLLASGPTLLAIALASELHGQTSVVGAAAAFCIGSLLAPTAVGLIGRTRLPATVTWPLWGVGMLIGWIAAPWHLVGLLGAQFLSGVSLTALEGATDARVARDAGAVGDVTTALAWSAASRAMGSSVAVRLLPLVIAAPAIGLLSANLIGLLLIGATLAMAAARALQPGRAATSPWR
jgi:hypothetical protein